MQGRGEPVIERAYPLREFSIDVFLCPWTATSLLAPPTPRRLKRIQNNSTRNHSFLVDATDSERRPGTEFFRANQLWIRSGGEKKRSELAEQFNVHASRIAQWKSQLLEGGFDSARKNLLPAPTISRALVKRWLESVNTRSRSSNRRSGSGSKNLNLRNLGLALDLNCHSAHGKGNLSRYPYGAGKLDRLGEDGLAIS